ncbi:hypothetical protein Mgra_00005135 [Meloidogyne graminicola]|uniref:Uncharacterized protein n=1 Tax=Meloidogyne graminicola TaxID=189291 RepID=A0A8S9ZPY1_9BILA|nr:hypothetical protein Mgra_00005135 [Meloidogyne graminicola]
MGYKVEGKTNENDIFHFKENDLFKENKEKINQFNLQVLIKEKKVIIGNINNIENNAIIYIIPRLNKTKYIKITENNEKLINLLNNPEQINQLNEQEKILYKQYFDEDKAILIDGGWKYKSENIATTQHPQHLPQPQGTIFASPTTMHPQKGLTILPKINLSSSPTKQKTRKRQTKSPKEKGIKKQKSGSNVNTNLSFIDSENKYQNILNNILLINPQAPIEQKEEIIKNLKVLLNDYIEEEKNKAIINEGNSKQCLGKGKHIVTQPLSTSEDEKEQINQLRIKEAAARFSLGQIGKNKHISSHHLTSTSKRNEVETSEDNAKNVLPTNQFFNQEEGNDDGLLNAIIKPFQHTTKQGFVQKQNVQIIPQTSQHVLNQQREQNIEQNVHEQFIDSPETDNAGIDVLLEDTTPDSSPNGQSNQASTASDKSTAATRN